MNKKYIKIITLLFIAVALIISGIFINQIEYKKLRSEKSAMKYIAELDNIEDSSKIIIRKSASYLQNNTNAKFYLYQYNDLLYLKVFKYKDNTYQPFGDYTTFQTNTTELKYCSMETQDNKIIVVVCGYNNDSDIDHYNIVYGENMENDFSIDNGYVLNIHILKDNYPWYIESYDQNNEYNYRIQPMFFSVNEPL
ncbi:MAG: hypothetical protein ACLUVC_04665 [Longibaculum sp.]